MTEKTLFIIPARGGSKGIPGKNIKLLNGKPLIRYSIDYARSFTSDENICVTTDDYLIINSVEEYGLKIPFIRPSYLATDTAGTYEVLIHALNYYKDAGITYEKIVLLQPTSPFRNPEHFIAANSLFSTEVDMVVSVSETKANPYYNLFEENAQGFLCKSKPSNFIRRQDCPPVYEYNGSIYIINAKSLRLKKINQFETVIKYVMPLEYSIDLDTPFDWKIAELLLTQI